MSNKLIVAAAGSGKTNYLVDQALEIIDVKVLITTYTEANEAEIRNKIIEKNKFLPSNITVQTWFSFLLQHGVRPYQGYFFDHDIRGMNLVNSPSAQYIAESNITNHYFDKQQRIYSDKISKFLIKCNEASGGKVIDRLSRIYPHIFIDEIQDLAGHDLDFLKMLFNSTINMLLVGDPRQGIYSTSNAARNKKFAKHRILHFFEDSKIGIEKDETSLTINYRSIAAICDLSNKLFPEHVAARSGNAHSTGHDGIFLVRPRDVDVYLTYCEPLQLRNSRDPKKIIENLHPIMNFGESKGLSFDRVLIYPTKPFLEWLKNNTSELASVSRSKLYVAITRARYSVAFVYDFKDNEQIVGAIKFDPATLNQQVVAFNPHSQNSILQIA